MTRFHLFGKKNHNRRYMAFRLLWIEMESEMMVWERMGRKKKDKQHFAVFVDISEICSSEFKRLIWNTTRRNYNKKL